MRRGKRTGAAPGMKGGFGERVGIPAFLKRAGCAWLAGSLLWFSSPGLGRTSAAESAEAASGKSAKRRVPQAAASRKMPISIVRPPITAINR